MADKRAKRKRSKVGRTVRQRSGPGRFRAEEEAPEDGPAREKILRGRSNVGAPPEEPSRSETEGNVIRGRVVRLHGREATVEPEGGGSPVPCLLRKSTRVPHPEANALAVGDWVRFLHEGDPPHVLTEVEPRSARLARVRRGGLEHVIAANVDLGVIVSSAERPPFKPRLVDRYLLSAHDGGVEPALVLNKVDLVTAEDAETMLAPYRPLGFPVLAVSALTGRGVDELRALLRNRTSVFSGQSGVGKSSLLNRLLPDLDLTVADVYGRVGKGRHTTTASTLYRFPFGGDVIDTPGFRAFAVGASRPESLPGFFPEIAEAAAECRFTDCAHAGEPGCALPAAIEAGRVQPERLESWRILREEIEGA